MKVGLLGMSEMGLSQLEYLVEHKIELMFVTGKYRASAHADEYEVAAEKLCKEIGVSYLGNVDVNQNRYVQMARKTDVCIIGGHDRILRANFLEAPKHGVVNTHFGLIPEKRGCYPVMWAILYGEVAGYTSYVVTPEIDLGEVIDRQEMAIREGANALEVYGQVSELAVSRFGWLMERLEEWKWPKIEIDKRKSCYHKQGMPNDSWLSWQWQSEFLIRFSRCLDFPPYKGSRTEKKSNGEEVEFIVEAVESMQVKGDVGEVLEVRQDRLIVQAADAVMRCRLGKSFGGSVKAGEVFESKMGEKHPIPLAYDKPVLDKGFCAAV